MTTNGDEAMRSTDPARALAPLQTKVDLTAAQLKLATQQMEKEDRECGSEP
jgi:hypothetical protein